jgi:3-oxoacyl-[acyl-carrier protein] reductase
MQLLQDKVSVITGGSRGIGRATAQKLAEAGSHVVINYAANEQAARETASLVESYGRVAILCQGDVSSLAEAETLIETGLKRFGKIDNLICNAGVWEGAAVEVMSEEMWDKVLGINLKGTWTVCRAAAPLMKRQESGKIVIISSTAGQRGEAFYSDYAAAKGGQISFVKSLATELGPFNINVNSVAPGWVDTEMSQEALRDPAQRTQIEQAIPLRRVAAAEDIAGPVVFLCTEWARHINGEILNVNGGSVLCG